MEEELSPVRTALADSDPDGRGVSAPPLSFGVIGVGRNGVEPNVKGLLRTLRQQRDAAESPSELLLLGFAGGVDPSLSPGDLVLAGRYCHLRDLGGLLMRVPDGMPLEEVRQRMMAEAEARDPYLPSRADLKFEKFRQQMMAYWKARDPSLPSRADLKFLEPDPGMWQCAREALDQEGLTAVETDSMTVDQFVTRVDTKRELHRQYQVGTVNMEDYWVARLAAAARVPFLSVRAVLDTAGQRLPSFLMELPSRSGWAALPGRIRPSQIPTLFRLMRQMPAAQESLARFALAFVSYRQGKAPSPPAAAT